MLYYREILDKIVESCRTIFEADLTGVYLHGSLAMGCFNPEKSDIDLIIVVERDISDAQKLAFMQKIVVLNELAPKKGIELSVVKRVYCEEFVYPTPYELHFSAAHLQWYRENPADYINRMKGTDKDLAAHFTIIHKYGKTLYGKEIKDVFGAVPGEVYLDSILYDINDAEEGVSENPVYFILNLCRVAAYVKEGSILSKKQGGEWGVQKLEKKYRPLLQMVLEYYTTEDLQEIDEELAKSFCKDMLRMIKEEQHE